ncbi:MAG TPA: cadmium resistance transporter, partial [Longimicrobiaceae bacterium]
ARRTRSQALAVAAVTVANGGDNLGVYIPLFASAPGAIPVYAAIFAVMTALWCWAGHRLVRIPWIGDRLRRYGHVLLPLVLIALGLWILSGARPHPLSEPLTRAPAGPADTGKPRDARLSAFRVADLTDRRR